MTVQGRIGATFAKLIARLFGVGLGATAAKRLRERA
jgi:hypothetical protein